MIVHLMLPDHHESFGLRGTAAYACDRDGTRNVWAPMRERTLHLNNVTCADCLAAVPAHEDRTFAEIAAEKRSSDR